MRLGWLDKLILAAVSPYGKSAVKFINIGRILLACIDPLLIPL
jgi:hypothetical protein